MRHLKHKKVSENRKFSLKEALEDSPEYMRARLRDQLAKKSQTYFTTRAIFDILDYYKTTLKAVEHADTEQAENIVARIEQGLAEVYSDLFRSQKEEKK